MHQASQLSSLLFTDEQAQSATSGTVSKAPKNASFLIPSKAHCEPWNGKRVFAMNELERKS